ncbi:MAG TPA: ABC transporter ATP-binding protein [Paenibacillaceae bacterium]|nr:ABC transporter ATP-binding protein [Paenibacillaceae bacterium]
MSREITLEVKNVKKKIRGKEIIKGISFKVEQGEIFGFLGPNGSGKTTTIRMLVGLIRPTAGNIEICGYDIQKHTNKALENVGCIVENPELYPYLTGMENLEHFARMLPHVPQKKIDEVVEKVDLGDRIHDRVKDYSLGMRQRLGIAQALLGDPKLLILDEPTNGLDPQGIKQMRSFIRGLADMGLSVFISSHLLSEIQLLCDRVGIILNGQVIHEGTVSSLLDESHRKMYWYVHPVAEGEKIIKGFSAVKITHVDHEEGFIITESDEEWVPLVNEELVKNKVKVSRAEWKKPVLEDLFLKLTGGNQFV